MAMPWTNRRGMSLVELLVAVTIFALLVTGALTMLEGQVRAFSIGTERMAILQNLRFAANTLEKDLRTVGSGVPGNQPFLVYAGADVIVFNADYTSNVAGDISAVYVDTTADAAIVSSLTSARRFVLPGTNFAYPDTTYRQAGAPSPAETIIFFFTPDTSTARSDDFVLMRQVNDAPPEVVARNLLRTNGGPFFTYLRLSTPANSAPTITEVPAGSLPLRHTVPIHLSAADTGAAAAIDSIRAVRVRFTATNGATGPAERQFSMSRVIRMPNAGMAVLRSCGDQPILGTALDARVIVDPSTGKDAVELTWNAATDEIAGERDAVRYVLWRRLSSEPEWGDPYISIPIGASPYVYVDTRVTPGESYDYALAVQDCTPAHSQPVIKSGVVIPNS